MKPPLLFLSHRIPYPPDKGDKIRSYNLLVGLARSYRIFLGACVDDVADWAGAEKLEALCEEVCLVGLSRPRKLQRAAIGMLSGRPLTMAFYKDRKLEKWVNKVVAEHRIERAFAFSGGVAPLMDGITSPKPRCVIDFVDVDSAKWGQYALTRRWPSSALFEREARLLLEQERRLATRFDLGVFVSRRETELFMKLAPELSDRVTHVNNGVDSDYFAPGVALKDPYEGWPKTIVFTGAMNYWPNIDAVCRFCEDVMPRLLELDCNWRFYVVGSNPDRRVLALQGRHSTNVTGRVEDVRPWIGHASVVVAPMQLARGVQNKVLEAMSMARPVIVSPQALEGIDATPGVEVVVASDPEGYIQAITTIDAGRHLVDGVAAREFVVREFSWTRSVDRLASLIEGNAHKGNST